MNNSQQFPNFFKSFFYVLSSRERTKAPGTRKVQSDSSLFRSCKQHPSVKEPLPLESFCCFLGDADLPQLVTRQGEHLTNGRTVLSLNPKINRLQVVSFNGAGFP